MKPALKLKIIMGQAAEKSKYLAGIDQADAAQVAGLKNGPLTSSSASTAPELSDDEFADLLHWVQNGAVEDALTSFDEALLTPIQASGASLLDPLTPLGNERRMLDYLEGIGKRYGSYGDASVLRTGQIHEIGGIVGLLDGELVASPIYSSRQSNRRDGLMDLRSLRLRLMDQYPEFVPLYDWHFHSSAELRYHPEGYPPGIVAELEYGFSKEDIATTGASPLTGSYVVMSDRILYVSNARADQVAGQVYAPPQPIRQWEPVNSPWPWRWPQ